MSDMTEQDVADLKRLHEEPSAPEPTIVSPEEFHPVLEIWREVLRPAKDEMNSQITPQWANRIVSSFTEVTFNDMEEFRTRYFTKILELATILEVEIDSDDECLNYTDPAEDAKENAHHYKNLLLNWQMAVLQWELDWDTMDEWAAVELAAISEVHKMFFGDTGITAYLDVIGFQFTEDDQQALGAALEEQRGGRE